MPSINGALLKTGVASIRDLRDGYLAGSGLSMTRGQQVFLDPTNGDDAADGGTPEAAVATLEEGYDRLVADRHDALIYIAGPSSISLTEEFVWAKNYTHFFGICAPVGSAKRARIFQDGDATGLSPLFTISATGCMFRDLYIFQGVADATSLINVEVSGGRNYFENIHFAGGGHATQAVNGGAALHLNGAEENDFVRCVIGVDTAAQGNGFAGLLVAAAGGAPRNRFWDCLFTLYAGHAGVIHVELLNNSGLDRDLRFTRCDFENLAAQAMDQVFAVDAGFDPANKRVLMKGCTKIGAAKWDAADTGMIFGDMNAVTGADLSGNLVELVT